MGWNYLSIPKLQRLHRWSLRMDKQFHPTLYQACNYLYMLGLKLNHVSKRGHSQWTGSSLVQIRTCQCPMSQIWIKSQNHTTLHSWSCSSKYWLQKVTLAIMIRLQTARIRHWQQPTWELSRIFLTPVTSWFRNVARSVLWNNDLRTDAICTRHDSAIGANVGGKVV